MRYFLLFAIVLWTSVDSTVSSQTLSTISGPQGNPTISALTSDDCLSTVDWHEMILITAVPIAAGFGLLLLAAFLKDLRQACKSNRSRPPAPRDIKDKRAKKCTYTIGIEYGGLTKWDRFLRWCIVHFSPELKNPQMLRLCGSAGFSNWVSFDLLSGQKSEQKTVTTPHSIGELLAIETFDSPINDTRASTGTWLNQIFKRACDTEIRYIHAKNTKTKDHFFTTMPVLCPITPPSYITYYLTNASLWISTFMPRYQGNFTGVRHVTLLFLCMSHTMAAVNVLSMKLPVKFPLDEIVVLSWPNLDLTVAMVIKAAVVGGGVFALISILEIIFRATPTVWSLCVSPRQYQDAFLSDTKPTCVQSAAGDFYGGSSTSLEDIPRMSSSASDIMEMQSWKQAQMKQFISYSDLTAINNNNNNGMSIIQVDQTSKMLSTKTNTAAIATIILLILHILLIMSCVVAVWWSIYFQHGFCWRKFLEWAATAIMAILIQAVIYDTIKAGIMTLFKRFKNRPKPYSVIV